jgi:hypothetical protein
MFIMIVITVMLATKVMKTTSAAIKLTVTVIYTRAADPCIDLWPRSPAVNLCELQGCK